MNITNKYFLPESLVKAITFDDHKGEGYSVTELILPPRILQLRRRHQDEIMVDASERIWLLLGNAVHYILAKGKVINSLPEEKLEVKFDGIKVRGRPDLLHGDTILDYKITSVWNAIYSPEGKDEYIQQLNLYRYLYHLYGFPVNKLQICMILRDWQKSKVEGDYPEIPIKMIDIPLWELSKVQSFLKDRIKLHECANRRCDWELPFCTPDEIWLKPEKYAIIKRGNKRASTLVDTEEEAKERLKAFSKEYQIEHRSGRRVRCEDYCEVSKWCNQFQKP